MDLVILGAGLAVVGLFGFGLGAYLAGRVADERITLRDEIIKALTAEVGRQTAAQIVAQIQPEPHPTTDDEAEIRAWLDEIAGLNDDAR